MKKKRRLFLIILFLFVIAFVIFLLFPRKTTIQKEKKEPEIQMKGEPVTFKKYRINQQFYLKIPELFVEMSDEEVNKRYTNDFKPGLIFTDDSFSVNLLIHATTDSLTNDTLQSFLDQYKTTLVGANITKEEITTLKKGQKVAHLNYTIQNDSFEDTHHVLFFPILEKAVMVDFKYPKEKASDWDAVCEYTLNSLEYTI